MLCPLSYGRVVPGPVIRATIKKCLPSPAADVTASLQWRDNGCSVGWQRTSNHRTKEIQMGMTKADAIRPFSINVPDEALVDLRRRINATKWPERETVADATQGVQLATMQALARYWGTEYDWRKGSAGRSNGIHRPARGRRPSSSNRLRPRLEEQK